MARYQKPGFFTAKVFNPLLILASKLGLTMRGSRVLAVRGRKTGEWRTMPVNPLEFNGQRYLVAPRGETQWVRNLRVSGEAELRLGRKADRIRVEEVADADKPPILRAYLKKWAFETKKFFGPEGDEVTEADLIRVSPEHPVFRIL